MFDFTRRKSLAITVLPQRSLITDSICLIKNLALLGWYEVSDKDKKNSRKEGRASSIHNEAHLIFRRFSALPLTVKSISRAAAIAIRTTIVLQTAVKFKNMEIGTVTYINN